MATELLQGLNPVCSLSLLWLHPCSGSSGCSPACQPVSQFSLICGFVYLDQRRTHCVICFPLNYIKSTSFTFESEINVFKPNNYLQYIIYSNTNRIITYSIFGESLQPLSKNGGEDCLSTFIVINRYKVLTNAIFLKLS